LATYTPGSQSALREANLRRVLCCTRSGPLIGGVSLFGGRGSTYGALLGIAVIGSINNGMLLLELDSSARFMITAVVLLMAVIIDSLSRRDRQLLGHL
jgi:D-xylose transport system permease protein